MMNHALNVIGWYSPVHRFHNVAREYENKPSSFLHHYIVVNIEINVHERKDVGP